MSYRMRKSILKNVLIGIGIIVFAFAFMWVAMPHSDAAGTIRTLTAQGYTGINITGVRWWGRSEGAYYSTEFNAIAPNGTRVTGYVTSGLWAGNTVRLD